jgi:hypothetical protein
MKEYCHDIRAAVKQLAEKTANMRYSPGNTAESGDQVARRRHYGVSNVFNMIMSLDCISTINDKRDMLEIPGNVQIPSKKR